jgi:hypothetical protein
VAISDADAERLTLLNVRLQTLVSEAQSLRERCRIAAAAAQTWPDMSRATQLFVNLQRASPTICATTAIISASS